MSAEGGNEVSNLSWESSPAVPRKELAVHTILNRVEEPLQEQLQIGSLLA